MAKMVDSQQEELSAEELCDSILIYLLHPKKPAL